VVVEGCLLRDKLYLKLFLKPPSGGVSYFSVDLRLVYRPTHAMNCEAVCKKSFQVGELALERREGAVGGVD
jgi:hypothetical protein